MLHNLKKCLENKSLYVGLSALVFVLLPFHEAHAYIDPGTGSYVLQIVIGVLFGAAFAIKSFWGTIVGTIRGRGEKVEKVETKTTEEEENTEL